MKPGAVHLLTTNYLMIKAPMKQVIKQVSAIQLDNEDLSAFEPDQKILTLLRTSRTLNSRQVNSLQRRLKSKESAAVKVALLGYYASRGRLNLKQKSAYTELLLWLINAHPASFLATTCQYFDDDPYQAQLMRAWLRRARYSRNVHILNNAAGFLYTLNPNECERLWKRVVRIKPSVEGFYKLARYYSLQHEHTPIQKSSSWANLTLSTWKKALSLSPNTLRGEKYLVYRATKEFAEFALASREYDAAIDFASWLLRFAKGSYDAIDKEFKNDANAILCEAKVLKIKK